MRRKHTKQSKAKRIEKIKEEIKQKFPEMEFTQETTSLLRLVGTMSYFPNTKDKEEIDEAIARKYQ